MTFEDTYIKVAQAKLYKMKTSQTAADLLKDKVLPFFEKLEVVFNSFHTMTIRPIFVLHNVSLN